MWHKYANIYEKYNVHEVQFHISGYLSEAASYRGLHHLSELFWSHIEGIYTFQICKVILENQAYGGVNGVNGDQLFPYKYLYS